MIAIGYIFDLIYKKAYGMVFLFLICLTAEYHAALGETWLSQ